MTSGEAILIGIIGILVGIAIGGILSGISFGFSLTEFLPALATLVAAFLGAILAFKLQTDKEDKKQKAIEIINGNGSLFTLIQMYNSLKNYQAKVIDPERHNPLKFITIQPMSLTVDETLIIDINKLTFMMKKNPQLLVQLKIEESCYNAAVESIQIRIKYHIDEVQIVLAKAGMIEGREYKLGEIQAYLGERPYKIINRNTDSMIDHVDKTVVSLLKAHNELRKELQEAFPNEKFVKFTPTSQPIRPY